MKISVNRHKLEDKSLKFEIIIEMPYEVPISENEEKAMKAITAMQDMINADETLSDETKFQISNGCMNIKQKIFEKVMNALVFDIENTLKPRFEHMCEEIYNFIVDHQPSKVKLWLSETYPDRLNYYFDNDKTNKIENDDFADM